MRNMKDSGVAWIGNIPINWTTTSIKNYCTDIFAGGTPSTTVEEYWDGDISWLPSGACKDTYITNPVKTITERGLNESSTKMIPADTILMAMTGATCAKIGHLMFDSCANQSVTAYVNDKEKAYSRFLFYSLFAARESIETKKSGGAQGGINVDICKNVIVPFIDIEEQKGIADFLDVKCSQVDALIANVRAQIEKLKAYKQSLITEVVTKGLDPTVPMKDSGVDWIGEIPAHWSISRIKNVTTILRGASPRPIDDYLVAPGMGENWIKIGDTVKGHKYITQTAQQVSHEGADKSRRVHKGDLILTNSMSFGEPYILGINGCIHDGWLALTSLRGITENYMYYFLQSSFCYLQFKHQVAGGIVQNLNSEKVASCIIYCPPENEQSAIVEYLDNKCFQINQLIATKEAKIEKLEQYKKSLIYEYVTGKKEVKNG